MYIIIAILGYFMFLLIFRVLKNAPRSIPKSQKEKNEEKELQKWLKKDEAKHRDYYTYPEDWDMRRKFVAKRENYTCVICKRRGVYGFHVHHIIPLSKGGRNGLENLVYLCKRCHENQHEHMQITREKKLLQMREKLYWKNYWENKSTKATKDRRY